MVEGEVGEIGEEALIQKGSIDSEREREREGKGTRIGGLAGYRGMGTR